MLSPFPKIPTYQDTFLACENLLGTKSDSDVRYLGSKISLCLQISDEKLSPTTQLLQQSCLRSQAFRVGQIQDALCQHIHMLSCQCGTPSCNLSSLLQQRCKTSNFTMILL